MSEASDSNESSTRHRVGWVNSADGIEMLSWLSFTAVAALAVYGFDALLVVITDSDRGLSPRTVFGDGSLFVVAAVFGFNSLGELIKCKTDWRQIFLVLLSLLVSIAAVALFVDLRREVRLIDAETEPRASFSVRVNADTGKVEKVDPGSVELASELATARAPTYGDLIDLGELAELERLIQEQTIGERLAMSEVHGLQTRVSWTAILLTFASMITAGSALWIRVRESRE
ncbi:MAG: hypothetical protein AAFZ07_04035 [Actinomycetota bacterium]